VFGDWIFFALIALTVFVYRRRDRGSEPAGFRVPGYPVVPAAFVLVAGYIVLSDILSTPRNAAFGFGLILLGVPIFYFWRRQLKSRAAPRREIV